MGSQLVPDPSNTLQTLREAVKIDQQILKNKLLSNLFFFNRALLDLEKGKDKVALSTFHKELCTFIDDNPRKQKLLLVPRGHLKSSLVTIGKSLQWIVENPQVRILIVNATYSMATSFLTVIKRHLKNNQLLRELFGDLTLNAEKWSENMITLASSVDTGGEKEATVFCYGMQGNLVSQHYDKIILDDVVNEGTVNTRDQIEKTVQFYRMCQPLLEKDGEMIVIGTTWHEEDLYGYIRNKENGIIQDFSVFERSAITNELWDNSKQEFIKGDVLWPEKYGLKELSKIRRTMGPWAFSSQYMLNPVPPDTADFKREWFKYYEQADLKGSEMNRYTLIDPAISLDQDADYTAMITVGIDVNKNVYILDILRERMKPDEIIQNIFANYERWHPQAIGIEEVAFQRALRYSIKQEEQKRKRFLNMIELKPHARSKDQRVRGLQPLYANGRVLHNKDLVYNIYLEDELLRFPRGKHDDIIDALAYSLDVLHPPVQRNTPWKKHKYLY